MSSTGGQWRHPWYNSRETYTVMGAGSSEELFVFLNVVGITWIGRVTSAGVSIIQTDISNDANALLHVQIRGNHAITRKSVPSLYTTNSALCSCAGSTSNSNIYRSVSTIEVPWSGDRPAACMVQPWLGFTQTFIDPCPRAWD